MSDKDVLWRKLLGEEKQRLLSQPVEELLAMKPFTPSVIKKDGLTIEFGIWHEIHSEDIAVCAEEAHKLSTHLDRSFRIPRPQRVSHTFVLQASRTIFRGLYRKYHAGFSIDSLVKIAPVSDDTFAAYD